MTGNRTPGEGLEILNVTITSSTHNQWTDQSPPPPNTITPYPFIPFCLHIIYQIFHLKTGPFFVTHFYGLSLISRLSYFHHKQHNTSISFFFFVTHFCGLSLISWLPNNYVKGHGTILWGLAESIVFSLTLSFPKDEIVYIVG